MLVSFQPLCINDLLMNYFEHIEKCNSHNLDAFRPFILENIELGYFREEFATKLLLFKDVFEELGNGLTLSVRLKDFPARSQAIDEVVKELILQGDLPNLRNEFYPVSTDFFKPPYFQLDRAAIPFFGVRAFGVHLNGFITNPDGSKYLWVARRAADRLVCPEMLDNTVAGGQPIGMGLFENLIKECDEEASIKKSLSKKAVPVGAVSYIMESETGLKPDTLYCFDLELPPEFLPINKDGEISDFYLWPVEHVAKIVSEGFDFKFNCNLVLIDFFIRHGFIEPDYPYYLELIKGLRSSNIIGKKV